MDIHRKNIQLGKYLIICDKKKKEFDQLHN